jgi:hypothetical protein
MDGGAVAHGHRSIRVAVAAEWTLDDGRVGYGLSEYLDQIIDGKPVGVDE